VSVCDQCQRTVEYSEKLVAVDPHGLEYTELRCSECGGALGVEVVEVEPSVEEREVERLKAKMRAEYSPEVRKVIADVARKARLEDETR